MKITIKRLKEDSESTIGFMHIDRKPMYFTLEDAFHEEKIPGKTRIPSGKYEIKLRNAGGMTKKYAEKYGESFHKGMLWLQGVPNYEWVYIHTGNIHKHTEGCILVGVSADLSKNEKNIGRSVDAYKAIYPIIRDAILSGEKVTIEIS